MAITLNSNQVEGYGFSVNGSSADLSGAEELSAAVTGKSIHLERLVISFGAGISVTIGAGETGGAVTAVLVGPIYGAANTTIELVFSRPIALPAATALVADASGAGNVTIFAQGYVR